MQITRPTKEIKKSTSGVVLFLVGPNTLAPITAFSKAQSCVSHSSTESELVALGQCIRSEASADHLVLGTGVAYSGMQVYIRGYLLVLISHYLTSPPGVLSLGNAILKSLFLAMRR